jgi:hypothetical protein
MASADPKDRAHGATERDLHAERAAALGRATERLEAALGELAAAEAACAPGETETARGLALRRDALAHAGERLWYLVIQREALGLRRHEETFELLRVPRAVRAAMGPRRR